MPVWKLNLKQECNICGDKITSWYGDIIPVFLEEKILLSAIFKDDIYEKSVWSLGRNTYLVDSKKMTINIEELNKKKHIKSEYEFILKNIDNYSMLEIEMENIERFTKANEDRFKEIEIEGHTYIQQIYKENRNRIPIVSFSGGKDSIVTSDIVRQALSNHNIIHIFGNTTLEVEETIEFVNEFKKMNPQIPFIEAKSDKNFFKLCEEIGPPPRVKSWCCSIFKSGPIAQVLHAINYGQDIEDIKPFLTFYGIRGEESATRDKYGRTSDSPKITSQRVVSPVYGWLDFDIWLYILSRRLAFNRAYRKGYRRVGCWCCPSNSKWSEALDSIFISDKQTMWKELLYNFAQKAGKKDYKDYVDKGFWKGRYGGEGLDNTHTKVVRADCIDKEYENFIINKPYSDSLDEYLKPFGSIQKRIKDNLVSIDVYNGRLSKKLFVIETAYDSRIIKWKSYTSNNKRLLRQRVECQLRKYQICTQCSACDSICKNGAITTLNNIYSIDEEKCVHCLECIAKHFTGGCLMNEALIKKGGVK